MKTSGVGSKRGGGRGRPVRRASAPVTEGAGPAPAVQPVPAAPPAQPVTEDRDPDIREGESRRRRRQAYVPAVPPEDEPEVDEETAVAVRGAAAEAAYRKSPSWVAGSSDRGDPDEEDEEPPEPGSEVDVEA